MDKTRDVLVVEDDATLNGVVCRYIKMAGFAVRAAFDGESALRAVREQMPGIVLLDLMLPDITGYEVCVLIKGNQLTSSVPVVMVTALSDDESRKKGMACGAVDYLTKPFDPDQLVEAIRKYAD